MFVVGTYDLVIAQVLPVEWQEKIPRLTEFAPAWSWQTWSMFILSILLLAIFEKAYRLIEKQETAKPQITASISRNDPPYGVLDYQVLGPKAMEKANKAIDVNVKLVSKLTQQLNRNTERIEKSAGDPSKTLKISNKAADDIDRYIVESRKQLVVLQKQRHLFDLSLQGLRKAGLEIAPDVIRAFHESAVGALDGTIEFRKSAETLINENLSASVTTACRRLIAFLDEISVEFRGMQDLANTLSEPVPDPESSLN